MSNDTLPPNIIGGLPRPDAEIEIDELADVEDLRSDIVGSLPPPPNNHRVVHTEFNPDGRIVKCACGFTTSLCHSERQSDEEFLLHLAEVESL